jgi:hypothetical protein|tara:strand:- start:808 stop:1029 length:222 start_codon:yes stop_codon:yes gene_type:complete
MIEIEDNIKIKGRSKYSDYFDILYKMKSGQSFLVDSYYIVDAVRHKAWEKKIPLSFRTIKETGEPVQYRIWRK